MYVYIYMYEMYSMYVLEIIKDGKSIMMWSVY